MLKPDDVVMMVGADNKKESPKMLNCGTCKFAEDVTKKPDEAKTRVFRCRRNPPQVVSDSDDSWTEFPTVTDSDWCGEHRTHTDE